MGSSWIVHEINVYVCLFLFDSWENRCKIKNESFSIVFYLFHISKSSSDFGYHLACEKGYTRTDCGTKCFYPLYGEDCQSLCDCNVTNCDHIYGCKQSSEGRVPHHNCILCTIYRWTIYIKYLFYAIIVINT